MSVHDSSRALLGREGEGLVAAYLVRLGWRILERNWRSGHDEVDLIAIDPGANECVIVEVKSFSQAGEFEHTSGWNWRKKRALKRAIGNFLQNPPTWLGPRDVRIDLILVCQGQIEHFRSVTW